MNKNFCVIVASISFLLLLTVTGCGRSSKEGAVLASIGSSKITVESFNERVSNLPVRYQQTIKRRKKEFLEGLISDTLLYQEAIRKGLHKDKDVLGVIEEARKKILIARLLKDEVDDKIEITEEDILVYYNDNKSDYMTPEIMRVSHILVQSREEAENILEQLEGGKDFEDLAKAKSVDPTAQRGGDVGYFPKGQLMPEFENACARLEVDQTSGVVKTMLGYHIIKLTDRRQPQLKPVDTVMEKIGSRLRTIERQKIFNALLDRLHEETEIEIDEEVLSGIDETSQEK
ncbi:MAG: peptidylprolyl isomerase [Candidatus Omnitrophota bacterium]